MGGPPSLLLPPGGWSLLFLFLSLVLCCSCSCSCCCCCCCCCWCFFFSFFFHPLWLLLVNNCEFSILKKYISFLPRFSFFIIIALVALSVRFLRRGVLHLQLIIRWFFYRDLPKEARRREEGGRKEGGKGEGGRQGQTN